MTKPWYQMTPAERLEDRIAKNRVIAEQATQVAIQVQRAPKVARKSLLRTNGAFFSHDEVFPQIAVALRTLCEMNAGYVGHREIREALEQDAGLEPFLSSAMAKDTEGRSKKWWAESMMKWFSQAFTENRNPFDAVFEREPNVKPWRYRLKQR